MNTNNTPLNSVASSMLSPARPQDRNSRWPVTAALLAGAFTALLTPGVRAAVPSDPHEAKAREILERVIAFKTEEGMGQVPAMAEYLGGELRAAGIPEADIHIFPLGETASFVARYRGDGSGGRPIVLMAHMDVVTARPEDWERDPFKLIEENGYFYGRGTVDIKNGVTSIVATLLRLKAEKFVPTRDLIVVFTGDEETYQKTAEDLVKNHKDFVDAEYALNADGGGGRLDDKTGAPISYALQTAEKSYADFELTTHNPGGHSSQPRQDNAIYDLADVLKRIQAYQFPVMYNDTTIGYFKVMAGQETGPLADALRRFAEQPGDETAAETLSQYYSYVGMTRTTCVPTMLRGGHAPNALPQSATVNVNCRIFPGVPIQTISDTLQKVAGEKVTIATMGNPISSPPSPLRKDIVDAVTRAVHERHPGIPIIPTQVSGASDAIWFNPYGIPTYGVGETFIRDSDDFAHGLNERIPVKSFYDGLEFWHSLVTQLAGRAH
jgi:acetylornithine deacetylase/succinyl-diaminopimelate desuccinylase-like protein